MEKKTDLVTFRVPRSTLVKLEAICETEDRPRSYVVRKLIERGLAQRAEPRIRPRPRGKA